jgi:glutathione S-transferase
MKLYYAPGACSLAVHIALREVGAAFELERVDLARHTLADGSSYTDIAPRGYVPMLALPDGTRHTEAVALLQYVADLDPANRLIGRRRSSRRLKVVEWLTFVATELHKMLGWLWYPDTAESTREKVMNKLARRFAELEQRLSAHEWLTEEYSVADAYAFTTLSWTRPLGLPMQAYPGLSAFLARVATRPRVREALAAEGV